MKKYTIEYIENLFHECATEYNSHKMKRQNALADKIHRIGVFLSKQPSEYVKIVNMLLKSSDEIVLYYCVGWCVSANYKLDEATAIYKRLSLVSDKDRIFIAINSELFLSRLAGKYGGWKRSEAYPDLSEYEKE